MDRLLINVGNSVEKNMPQYRALVLRRYPDFVYQRHADGVGNQIPVFVFHTLVPEIFEAQLRYLTENGYRSIRSDELTSILGGDRSVPPKTVALTMDDGLLSLWAVGHPLLRKYGHVAISFVVAGLVPEGSPRPTLADVWEGSRRKAEITALERIDGGLANWAELRTMAAAGTVDIQSHSYNHDRVYVSSKIVDFINPWFDYWFYGRIHVPVYLEKETERFDRDAPWGTPVYEYLPRMQAPHRFLDDEELRESCVNLVSRSGGEGFFQDRDWMKRLRAHVRTFRRIHGNRERFTSEEAFAQSIRWDLGAAREVLEEKLGLPIRHLCYPWFYGSDRSVRVSREVGYTANHWGDLPHRRSNSPGDDPFYIVRISDEFIFRLPGAGRASLASLLLGNVRSNLTPFLRRVRVGTR